MNGPDDGAKSGRDRGPAGPGRQFHVPAPGGTPDPPRTPSKPSATPSRVGRGATPPPPDPGMPVATKGRSRKGVVPGAPPASAPAGSRSRRRWVRWVAVGVPLLLVAGIAVLLGRGYLAYRSIDRVDLSGVLDPVAGDTVNYLLVGSDSRDGLDPSLDIGGAGTVTGRRSDTIILLRVAPGGSTMMSVPRDLWVTNARTGRPGRINGAYNSGPANLVTTVKQNLRVPVNHYMEVGFGSFVGMVDALGGVVVDFPHPAFDTHSGLYVDGTGPVRLDGKQALAYARSRHYTEKIGGRDVEDPTGDLGRQQRQQTFLRTALGEVGRTRNPVSLLGVTESLSSGLVLDDSIGLFDLIGLARKLSGSQPTTVVLPTRAARKGGAAVLLMSEPSADAVLAGFR